jgi:LmeA-like phospholipid-binding
VGRAGRVAVGLAGVAVLVLALAQVLLPGVAASRIASRLRRYGTVASVSVKAWPALELLWGRGSSVTVRAISLQVTPAQTARLLWEARGLSDIELTARTVREGPLRLSDVSLHKHADALTAQARMTETDVKAALPKGFSVALLPSEPGEVKLRASGGLFGVRGLLGAGGSLDAVAGASQGKLVVRPVGLPLGELTLFSQPHVHVEGVGASAVTGPAGALSYQLTIRASLK